MQPTKSGHRDNLAPARRCRRYNTPLGRVLPQTEMGSVLVVVAEVIFHQPSQMPLVQNNDVVQQVSTHASDPALRDAVLPRTSEGGSDGQDPLILHWRHDISVELRVTVENQELLRLVISPGLTQLQRNPIRAGILGHVEM